MDPPILKSYDIGDGRDSEKKRRKSENGVGLVPGVNPEGQ